MKLETGNLKLGSGASAEAARADVFAAAASELAAEIVAKRAKLGPAPLPNMPVVGRSMRRHRELQHLDELRICLAGMARDLRAGTLPGCLRHFTGRRYVEAALDSGRNFYGELEPIDREAVDALRGYITAVDTVSAAEHESKKDTENETMTTEQTTTDAAATTGAANHVATEDRLERIALELVYPTPENCRTMPWGATAAPELVVQTGQLALADETHEAWQDDRWRAMLELALSLREHGQVQPALVRVHPEIAGCYDLRAGERRMWAAKIAGLPTLLCVVRDLTDQQALEVTVNENLLRSDLTPLEEGAAIAQLLDRGWDVEGVAAHLGKSEKWVRRRAQIQMVTIPWRKRLRDPEHPASSWGVGHLEILARLPSETQNALLEELGDDHWYWGQIKTAADLWERTESFTRAMSAAPWNLVDAELLPKAGACAVCPKRSGCQPVLFDEDETEGDHCLDGGCWEAKTAAYVELRTAKLREEYGDELLLLSNRYNYGTSRERVPGITYQNDWDKTKKTDAAAVPGLVVAGDDAGKLLWVKLRKGGGSYGGGTTGADGKPKPKTLKERRAGLAAKRAAVAITQVQELLTAPDSEPVDILEDSEPLAYMLAVISAFGVSGTPYPDLPKSRDRWDAVTEQTSLDDQEVIMMLWRRLAGGPLLSTLAFETQAQAPDRVPAAKRVCEMIGADWDALLREATEACPEPKSWAKLNADGTPKTDKAAPKKKAKKTAKTKKKAQAEESEVDTHQPGVGEECPACGAEVPTDDDGCLCEDCGRGVCAACVDVTNDGDVRCAACARELATEESEVAE